MPFHHAAIRLEDGSTVARDVVVTIDELPREGSVAWFGTISLTEPASLSAGRKYRLVLDDGRTGEFLVRRNTSAGGADRAVAIHGTGPLR